MASSASVRRARSDVVMKASQRHLEGCPECHLSVGPERSQIPARHHPSHLIGDGHLSSLSEIVVRCVPLGA
jgi:hypothetical protein